MQPQHALLSKALILVLGIGVGVSQQRRRDFHGPGTACRQGDTGQHNYGQLCISLAFNLTPTIV